MDPDEALLKLRLGCQLAVNNVDMKEDALQKIAETFLGLDEWITGGGFLPQEWNKTVAEAYQRGDANGYDRALDTELPVTDVSQLTAIACDDCQKLALWRTSQGKDFCNKCFHKPNRTAEEKN